MYIKVCKKFKYVQSTVTAVQVVQEKTVQVNVQVN